MTYNVFSGTLKPARSRSIENKMVWGTYGSLKVTGNSTIRLSAYDFLLAFYSNYVPILHYILRYSETLVENCRF